MNTSKIALHEAATLAGFTLYVGGDHLNTITHVTIDEDTRRGNRAPGETRITVDDPALTYGKLMLCSMAADYITSGETDSFAWLENRLEDYGMFLEYGAAALHPVFDQVVADLREVWPSVEHIAGELERRRYIPGNELHALAQRAGLLPAVVTAPSQKSAPRAGEWLKNALSFITKKLSL